MVFDCLVNRTVSERKQSLVLPRLQTSTFYLRCYDMKMSATCLIVSNICQTPFCILRSRQMDSRD